MKKPIRVGLNTYINDSNFKAIMFSKTSALAFAKETTRQMERKFNNGFKFSETAIKDCGDYFTISRW